MQPLPEWLPVAQWPELDRTARAAALTPGDYFSASGLAAGWSPATLARCDKEWGRYLAFLIASKELRDVKKIGERISDREVLRSFIDDMLGRLAPKSVAAALGHIAQAIRAFDPRADRKLLMAAWRNLRRSARSSRKYERLPPPKLLWELGFQMMHEADTRLDLGESRRAVLFRDGLLIAFLSICPLRARNVVALEEGVHLKVIGGGNALTILAEETKTGARGIETKLPHRLVSAIRRFWECHRKALARPESDASALWLTTRGTAMTYSTLYDRIVRRCRERLEIKFSPHAFRYAAATFIADVAPSLALIIVGVLGHTDIRTAEQHYIHSQRIHAFYSYQDEILKIISSFGAIDADGDE